MRTLAAGQSELVLQRDLAEVKLLTITTYSDRSAKTGATVYRFSDETVEYDGDTYSPLLEDVSAIVETMSHLPSAATGGDGDTLSRKLTFVLVNGDYQEDRLINIFEAGSGRMELAEVEYSTVLISAGERVNVGLREIAGSGIHQVWFRGVISRAPVTDDATITMEATTERYPMPWVYQTAAGTPRRDLGKRLPEIYGMAKRVECPLITGGWVTTLSKPLSDAEDAAATFTEEDSGWSSPFDALIDGERITFTLVSSVWEASSRGVNGTTAAIHQAGAVVVEIVSTVRFGLAGHACHSADGVYLRNLHTGQPWRLDPAYYTVDLADTTTISGETITSLALTSDDLQEALLEASTSALVSEQASYSTGTPTVTTITATGTTTTTATAGPLDGRWQSGSGTEPYYQRASWSSPERLTREYVSGDLSPAPTTDTIVRWRIKVRAECTNAQSWTFGSNVVMSLKAKFLHGGTTITAAAEGATAQCTRSEDDEYVVGDQTTIAYSAWFTPDDATETVDAFIGADLQLTCHDTDRVDIGPSVKLEIEPKLVDGDWGIEIEYTTSTLTTRVNDAAIQAAAMGHDLMLWADVNGHVVPAADSTYEVSAGTLIEHPIDILHHLIAQRAGLGNSAVDHSATFAKAADASHLGTGIAMGFDARRLGFSWEEIVLRVAWESRVNILPIQQVTGVIYKVRAPHVTTGHRWTWSETQDEYPDIVSDYVSPTTIGRSIGDLGSHFSAAYGFRADIGEGEEGFTQLVTEVPSGSEAALGVVEYPRFYLHCYTDDATAADVEDWLEYMAQELSREDGGVTDVTMQHWIAYAFELGDVVRIQPPWWTGGAKYTRLIEFSQTDRDDVACRFVEVL